MSKQVKRPAKPASKGKVKTGTKKDYQSEERSDFRKKINREFKEEKGDDKKFREKESTDSKKSRNPRPDNEGSFKRYRDNARPSDFAGAKKRVSRNENRENTDEKPAFKKQAANKEKRSFLDKPKPVFKPKINPYDLDEQDLEYGKSNGDFKKEPSYKKKPYKKKEFSERKKEESKSLRQDDGTIRLNKYISNAGICSRREADDLIASGVVQVNGKTVTEMGYRVKPSDIIKYGGQTLKKERMVYLVLNKPKDYITTADDPQKRKTVLELVQGACKERIYPVGRLDRSTTGLLMFTNDGELTKKLTHPRYGVRKIYHVELDKPLKKQDLEQISEGLELEDGQIKVDEISYVGDAKDKTQIGVELHSGKNRIVRRIFEHFGYNVRKLDRVMFGSLTKKDLPRGRWRFLTDAEVGILNMISTD